MNLTARYQRYLGPYGLDGHLIGRYEYLGVEQRLGWNGWETVCTGWRREWVESDRGQGPFRRFVRLDLRPADVR